MIVRSDWPFLGDKQPDQQNYSDDCANEGNHDFIKVVVSRANYGQERGQKKSGR
jgi:hypothetical protein